MLDHTKLAYFVRVVYHYQIVYYTIINKGMQKHLNNITVYCCNVLHLIFLSKSVKCYCCIIKVLSICVTVLILLVHVHVICDIFKVENLYNLYNVL